MAEASSTPIARSALVKSLLLFTALVLGSPDGAMVMAVVMLAADCLMTEFWSRTNLLIVSVVEASFRPREEMETSRCLLIWR